MAKRGSYKRALDGAAGSTSMIHSSLSLREEASGKKQSHNVKSVLKLKHLEKLAKWTSKELSILPLGAFFGRRFAECGEALGISTHHSLFICERCETILQPGFNCRVRIERNRSKRSKHREKTNPSPQNNVVYTCLFCAHRNMKRGTPKGYVRNLGPSKAKHPVNLEAGSSTALIKEGSSNSEATEASSQTPGKITCFRTESPTSLVTTGAKLLDSKRRKRKPVPKGSKDDEPLVSSAPVQAEKADGASRKRRKSWTTLKEIAENQERERNERFKKFSFPFNL